MTTVLSTIGAITFAGGFGTVNEAAVEGPGVIPG
jgi:hypothetical protein